MEDKLSVPTNTELNEDQVETKDSFCDEDRGNGDGEEKPAEGIGSAKQQRDSLSLSSEDSLKSDSLRSKIPRVNCPEHIILCLDLSPDMKSTSFQNKNVSDRTAFQLVQRAAEIFVKTKSKLNAQHKFCVIGLDDSTTSWQKNFTSDVEAVCSTLSLLQPVNELLTEGEYQMSRLFEVIQENVVLPHMDDILLPPPYVVRLIIVYGRSYCMPKMCTRAKQALFSQVLKLCIHCDDLP